VARKFLTPVDLGSNRINNVLDPASAQDAATRNYVDTTTAPTSYGGWGDGDLDCFGDLISTLPRNILSSGSNVMTLLSGSEYMFVLYARRAFTSTGLRYVTGASSATSGNTVSATLYTGTSQGAMTKALATTTIPFTTTSTYSGQAWSSPIAVPVGWVGIYFVCTAGTPKLMTPAINSAAGTFFLNPSSGQRTTVSQATTTVPSTTDLTSSSWISGQLTPWLALY
jgi:hypothetical protein